MLPTKFRFIWSSGFRGEDFFRNQPIRNKNCLWQPCLLTDRDKMCTLYRGTSIATSYKYRFIDQEVSEETIFLEIDQSDTRIACGSHVCKCLGTK